MQTNSVLISPLPAALRREAALAAGLCALALAGGFAVLAAAWTPAAALRWLPLPALGLSYLLVVLWRGLPANHRPAETTVLPGLGWGNRLTLLRGLLTALLSGFILLPRPPGWLAWVPGGLYGLVCAADFFDGYLARRTNHATRLGESLDMSFDGLGVLAAALLVVLYGQAPPWYLLVGLARYLFLAGASLRRRLDWPVYDLPPSQSRRVLAGLQMGFLAVILLPLFHPPAARLAAALFGLPLLLGFGRDWLHLIGWLHPAPALAGHNTRVADWLPLGLRLLALALNLALWTGWLSAPTGAARPLELLYLASMSLLALGILPHVSAGLALALLGIALLGSPLGPVQVALAIIYALLLYLGGGKLCLWAPEHNLYRRRAGEKPPAPGMEAA